METQDGAGTVISPMGIGEVLDTGFSLARRNYGRLLLLGAWGLIPSALLSTISTASSSPGNLAMVLLAVPLSVAAVVGGVLASGALMIACSRLIDPTGSPAGLDTAALYREALGRFWRLLRLGVIVGLLAIPLLILFPLGIWVMVRWSVAWPVLLVEGTRARAALRRSWDLTRGAWWHTALVLLVATLIIGMLTVMLGGLAAGIGLVIGGITGSRVVGEVIAGAVWGGFTLLLAPLSTGYYVILYYELRARREGYDLVQRSRQVTPA